MGAIRTLYTDLKLRAADAFKGLKAYDKAWKTTEKAVAVSVSAIERSSERAVAALQRMGEAAAVARTAARGVGGGGGSGGGRGRDPGAAAERAAQRAAEAAKHNEDALARRTAREEERAAREAERRQKAAARESTARAKPSRSKDPLDAIVSDAQKAGQRERRSDAGQAGLAAGAKPITAATEALGRFASAQEKAKAKVADLSAQVERNRRELAGLRAEAVRTGDADGVLAAKMRGLAAETGIASNKLATARGELRKFEGGLIDTIKQASTGRLSITALGTALGSLAAGAVTRTFTGIASAIGDAAKRAMEFEKTFVNISKVTRGADDTVEGLARIEGGIKETSKTLGVMPDQVAALAAQLAPVFSGKLEGGAAVDLVKLTSDVTKIGAAWDVSGEQAGKFFADTSRGLGTTTAETKSLFGSINELGNQIGVKSADIAEAVTRSAGVIKASGLSGETGAALNATLIAAGASAEVAATGVRTFVARLEAGSAATPKQMKAFEALGFEAVEVGKNMAKGGKEAEDQILKIVTSLNQLPKADQLPTLIELFGSESIGSIGAAATAVETLGTAFKIAGDKTAAATSVQQEYDKVSDTTAARVGTLKAQIAVLALEFGDALLPYIDRVVKFLSSPEGQEWGRGAVEKLTGAVVGAAEVVGGLVGFFGDLSDKVGGAENAIKLMGVAILALMGPIGLVTAALVTMLEFDKKAQEASVDIKDAVAAGYGPGGAHDQGDVVTNLAAYKASKASAELSKLTDTSDESERQDALERLASSGAGGRSGMLGEEKERGGIVPFAGMKRPASAAPAPVDTKAADAARFAELVRMRDADPAGLPPAEKKELSALSESLNLAIPKRPKKTRTHKETKMDRQLAAIDPSVRGVLTRGGESDKGGDLKVADNALDRAVFGKLNKANGAGGSGGGLRSVGPGPNITNHYTYVTTNVDQTIDARGNADAAANIAAASSEVAMKVGEVRFTGANRIVAQRNMGGVMRGPV